MNSGSEEKKEPLRLKIILPLLAAILILSAIFYTVNLSKGSFADVTTAQLSSSFSSFVAHTEDYDHYKLFVSEKHVTWDQGPSLSGFLQGIERSDSVSSVGLNYHIPVFINLSGEWLFNLRSPNLDVRAPMPTFGDAILDPTSLQIKFKSAVTPEQEGVIRDTLKDRLSSYRVALDSGSRASLEKESRTKLEDLLNTWINKSYSRVPELKYQISFSGADGSENVEDP